MTRTGAPDTARDWFAVERFDDVVTSLREPGHFQDVVGYRIAAGDSVLYVDAGMGFYSFGDLFDDLPSATALLTHCHWDHMGGAHWFSNVAIAGDQFETERLAGGWRADEVRQLTPEFFPGGRPSWLSEESFAIPGVSAFRTFNDGDRFDLPDDRLVVIHTPGHTPGSACFYLEQRGYLFTGDTLYPGPEYIHLPASSHIDYFRSLPRLLDLVGGRLTAIFPGHNAAVAGRELLERHVEAAAGRLPPDRVFHDEAGRFVEYVWGATPTASRFSFRLPPSFPGFA
ncbi:MAG: MBL fold metallo-hydrolase [Dehalococcoidia bacterium]